MWQKKLKKTIFTLNVNDYSKEVTEITYPLMQRYAERIGANFHIINERKFPDFPVEYEKLQIYELAQKMENDWNIYIDSDTIVHPETLDFTQHIPKDTVVHNGNDMAGLRWKYDRFFLRDGRNIGSCNWFTMASDWCIELWKPLDDLTLEEALARIQLTVLENNTNFMLPSHLIDDFTLSRNIAKYGLKFTNIIELLNRLNLGNSGFLWHQYTAPTSAKPAIMLSVLDVWQLDKYLPTPLLNRVLALREENKKVVKKNE